MWVSAKGKEDVEFPEVGVIDDCKPVNMGTRN